MSEQHDRDALGRYRQEFFERRPGYGHMRCFLLPRFERFCGSGERPYSPECVDGGIVEIHAATTVLL